MKKILVTLTLIFAMAWSTPALAQFKYGIVGGLNLTTLSFDKSKGLDSDNRFGWYIGPKVEFTLPIIGLGVDASVQYMTRRMNAEVNEGGDNYSESKTLQSLEIPINLKYNIGLGSLLGIYIATGPQFGYNISNKSWGSVKLKESNTTWNVGAGVKLLGHLQAGINYNIALSKFGEFERPYENSFKSNSWQVQVAYMF